MKPSITAVLRFNGGKSPELLATVLVTVMLRQSTLLLASGQRRPTFLGDAGQQVDSRRSSYPPCKLEAGM
jgi:hypothetical protein